MAIARYVEDQVRVPVATETRSRVKDAPSPSPLRRMSRVKKVTRIMNNGEVSKAMVLKLPGGTSSKNTLMIMNPAVRDSTTWRSHTISLGTPPPRIVSTMLSKPIPFEVPNKLASRKSIVASIILRVPLERSEYLCRASCSIYYTYLHDLNKIVGAVRRETPAALLYVTNQTIPLTGSQFLAQSYETVSVVAS